MMNLAEWREKQRGGEPYVTPSGLTVRLKPCSLLDLATRGEIPEPLQTSANELLSDKIVPLNVQNASEFEGMVNLVVMAGVVDPPIGEEATEAQMGIRELPFDDRFAIFSQLTTIKAVLRPFRQQPQGDGAIGPNLPAVRAEAKRSAGDR